MDSSSSSTLFVASLAASTRYLALVRARCYKWLTSRGSRLLPAAAVRRTAAAVRRSAAVRTAAVRWTSSAGPVRSAAAVCVPFRLLSPPSRSPTFVPPSRLHRLPASASAPAGYASLPSIACAFDADLALPRSSAHLLHHVALAQSMSSSLLRSREVEEPLEVDVLRAALVPCAVGAFLFLTSSSRSRES